VFPNPVKPGQTLYLPQEWKSKRLSWVSGQGRLLNWVESSTQAEVQVPSIFSAGVYYIVNDMQQAIQVMLSH
jgi:hypothetical protein